MTLTGLALYKVIFFIQLLVGEGMFLWRLERRRHFKLRFALAASAGLLAACLFPIRHYNAWYVSLLFFVLFGVSMAAVRVCFEEPWGNLLFCGIAGYTAQHLAYLCYTVLNEASGLEAVLGNVLVPYSSEPIDFGGGSLLQILLYVDCYVLVYGIVFDLFDEKLKGNHELYLGRTNMICLSGLLIGADVIFNMITNYYTRGNLVSLLLERGYNILLCLLILAMLYNQLSSRQLKAELASVRHIVEQGKSQYELAKKSMDLMNMKYHDLRHQSQLLLKGGEAARQQGEELAEAVAGYGAILRTGNEVLDVILTEKMLLCEKKEIQMTAMADGTGLDFMKQHHLYALLGNAIENAMEAVEKLPKEQRLISLFVKRTGNLVSIHVENPCQEPPAMRGGIPLTSKEDRDFHGFGMLSMRTIAEQYGGTLTVRAENGLFSVDIVMIHENGRG